MTYIIVKFILQAIDRRLYFSLSFWVLLGGVGDFKVLLCHFVFIAVITCFCAFCFNFLLLFSCFLLFFFLLTLSAGKGSPGFSISKYIFYLFFFSGWEFGSRVDKVGFWNLRNQFKPFWIFLHHLLELSDLTFFLRVLCYLIICLDS